MVSCQKKYNTMKLWYIYNIQIPFTQRKEWYACSIMSKTWSLGEGWLKHSRQTESAWWSSYNLCNSKLGLINAYLSAESMWMRRLRPATYTISVSIDDSSAQLPTQSWTDQVYEALLVWPALRANYFQLISEYFKKNIRGEKNIVSNGTRISDRKKKFGLSNYWNELSDFMMSAVVATEGLFFPPYSPAPRSPHMRSRPVTIPGGISYLKPDASSSRSSSAWRRNPHPHPDSTPPQVSRTCWWSCAL